MQIRIEGTDLPGRSCGASPDFPGYDNIHVGVRRGAKRDELLGLTPGDAPTALWTMGGVLVGRLGLTDAKGNPTCTAGRPPTIEWSAGPG